MIRAANTFKGPVGPLRHRCAYCQATPPKLLRCSRCAAVRYCSREHQAAHWQQHKSPCAGVKSARIRLAEEDSRVRNATADFMTPANAFETEVGRFWGIYSTRDYMRARFALAGERLLPLGTRESVQEALEHMRDMLRLCRGDNMGLREMMPAMMLRLDLDQECYDFVKWWATGLGKDYDFHDMNAPHLDLHGADAFEHPEFLVTDYPSLNHVLAILLLKMKLLVDIRYIRITRKVLVRPPSLPLEICGLVERCVVRSPVSSKLTGKSSKFLLQTESTLIDQVRQLGAALVKANDTFMVNLFDPDEALSAEPSAYSRGSWEEMALAMRYCYAAFWETAGVLDLINDARACAARDSDKDIEESRRKSCSSHTTQELRQAVGLTRLWDYLDRAVENASALYPVLSSVRPSK